MIRLRNTWYTFGPWLVRVQERDYQKEVSILWNDDHMVITINCPLEKTDA